MIVRRSLLRAMWFVAIVAVLCIPLCLCSSLSIDAVTLLLPPSDGAYSVSYPLSAHGGCFSWHTSHPSLLQVTPTPESQCGDGHTSVTIRPLITSTACERRGVWVWAIDAASGARLECEVFVDAIHTIQILTTTRRVNVNDVETLELIAFDASNNAFSAISGLPTQWTIQQSGILAAITLALSNIDAPAALYALEQSGLTSSILPVKGIHPGRVTVSAMMYGHISASVDITVTEPLILHPNFARIIPASQLTLQLMTRQRQLPTESIAPTVDEMSKADQETCAVAQDAPNDPHSTRQVIAMPNAQYVWRSTNNATLLLDDFGRIVALNAGSARVSVTDVNIAEHRKEADIHVVEPAALTVKLIDSDVDNVRAYSADSAPTCNGAYTVASGNALRLMIALSDSSGRQIDIAPNVHFTVSGDGESIRSSPLPSRAQSVVNAVFTNLTSTKTLGATRLTVTMDDVVAPLTGATYSPPPSLTADVIINVVKPIAVTSPVTHFPLIGASLDVPVNVSGGSGEYVWRSLNTHIATIEHNRVHFISGGDVTIDVVDKCDPRNSDHIVLTAAEPAVLEVLPATLEGLVGTDIEVFIKVADNSGDAFDECGALTLETHIEHGRAHTIKETNVKCQTQCPIRSDVNCFHVTLSCRHEGFTSIRFQIRKSATPPLLVTVSAFNALTVTPASLSLSRGQSGLISYSGGVIPWPIDSRDHSRRSADVVVGAMTYFVHDWSEWSEHERRTPNAFNESAALPIDVFDSADAVIQARLSSRGVIQVTCQQSAADDVALDIRTHNAPTSAERVTLITRATAHIQCLSPLIFPSKLTLSVGAEERLIGRSENGAVHPLNDQITYSTRDSAIVLVNTSGVVEAIGLGTAHVTASISNASTIGFSADIEVAVRFETFVIVAGSDILISGQTLWLHIEGARGEKPGDPSFNHVGCEWTTNDGGLVLLPAISSAQSAPNMSVAGYSVRVVAHRPGTWTVTALISVDSPDSPTPTLLSESVQIRVVEPLRLLSPSHLILTPNARTTIVTTHDDHQPNIRYVVIDAECASDNTPLVTVDSHGVIRAHQTARTADDTVIIIRSLAQSVVVHVSIRALHHLSVVSLSDIDAPLCPSHNVTLSVQAKDSLGRIFDGVDFVGDTASGDELVTYRVSRPDLIRVHRSPTISSQSAYNGVIAQFVCSAVASSETLQSAVLRLALINHTAVPALYIHMFVSAAKCISKPANVIIAFKVAPQINYSLTTKTTKRREFMSALTTTLSAATGVSVHQLELISIDPSTGEVEVLIKPAPPTQHRTPLQWFLTNDKHTDPMRVAELLQSKLRESPPPPPLDRMIDAAVEMQIKSDAERTAHESIWADERHSEPSVTPIRLQPATAAHADGAAESANALSSQTERTSLISRALSYAIPLVLLALPLIYYYCIVAPSMSPSAPQSFVQWLVALLVPRPPLMDPTRTAAPVGNVVDGGSAGIRRRHHGEPRFRVDATSGNVNGFIAHRALDGDALNISH